MTINPWSGKITFNEILPSFKNGPLGALVFHLVDAIVDEFEVDYASEISAAMEVLSQLKVAPHWSVRLFVIRDWVTELLWLNPPCQIIRKTEVLWYPHL